jgi:DNA-binding CsgD family transcriptional regulator
MALGLLFGIIYSLVHGSGLGVVLDLLLLAMLVVAFWYSRRKRLGIWPILGVASYGIMAIFAVDIVCAMVNDEPIRAIKIPMDLCIMLAVNIFIGLFFSRWISLFLGFGCAGLFAIATAFGGEPFYLGYNLLMQPAIIGITLGLFFRQGLSDRMKIAKEGSKPMLDLSTVRLTPAECACLGYVLKGHTIKEIAHIEERSESAIQSRMGSIYKKLEVPGRAELLVLLDRHQIVWPNDSVIEVLSGE